MLLYCLFRKHKPKRDHVKFDGELFRGHCRRCGAEIVRLDHGWAKAEPVDPRGGAPSARA